ncbi:Protein obstructor-E, partial [Fragariocoptes setiger]
MGPHIVTSPVSAWLSLFFINVHCCFGATSDLVIVAPLNLGINETRSDFFLTNQQPPYALDSININSNSKNNNNNTYNHARVTINRLITTSEPNSHKELVDNERDELNHDDNDDSTASDNDVYASDSSDSKMKPFRKKPHETQLHVKPNRFVASTAPSVVDNEDIYHSSMMFVLEADGEMPATVDPDMMPAVIGHNVEPIIDQLLGPRSPDEGVTYTPLGSMTTRLRRRRRRRTTTLGTRRPPFSELELKSTTPLFGLPSTTTEPPEFTVVGPDSSTINSQVDTSDSITMPVREIIRNDKLPETTTTTSPASLTSPPSATAITSTTVSNSGSSTKPKDRKPNSQRRDNAVKNSMCPPTGVSVIEHLRACDKYYICEDGKATLHTCPNGLLFGLRSLVLDYCVHRWNTTCGDKSQPDPIASPGCRWQFGLFSVQGSPRCSVDYYECRYGKYEVKRCPIKGQMWDERTKSCQWAEAIGCTSDALVSFECPRDDINNPFWPRPRYYLGDTDVIECIDNRPEVVHCEDGQHVSPETLHCVDPLPS